MLQSFVAYLRYVNGLPGGHPERVTFARGLLYALLGLFVLWTVFGR